MSLKTFQELSTILESDATDNTFKYALLRATAEICQNYTHLIRNEDERVWFPTGLLVEKWIYYYWNIFEKKPFIPQMPERIIQEKKLQLSFRRQFKKVIDYYAKVGGISLFYSDYTNNEIPASINDEVLDLMKKIRYSITRYPMKHLGYSVYGKHYPIFEFEPPGDLRKQPISREIIINKFGSFSISHEYYQVFSILGGFIVGNQSIISQWSRLTEKFTNNDPSFSEIYDILIQEPTTERQVKKIRNYYQKQIQGKKLRCVWSDMPIKSNSKLNIDHMLPFSKIKNNDLWNLVPTHDLINSKKGDKIPSLELIKKRKEKIVEHWDNIQNLYPRQFKSEIQLALVGYKETEDNFLETAFNALIEKTHFLLDTRKHQKWDG